MESFLSVIIIIVLLILFYGAMLIVLDKQKQWENRQKARKMITEAHKLADRFIKQTQSNKLHSHEEKSRMNDLFDKYSEWVGMPEFVQEKKSPYKEVIVRFETEDDFIEFQNLINQKMTIKTKSIWHPFKSHWGLDKKVYKDAP